MSWCRPTTFYPQKRPYLSIESYEGHTDERTGGHTVGHDLLWRCVVASKNAVIFVLPLALSITARNILVWKVSGQYLLRCNFLPPSFFPLTFLLLLISTYLPSSFLFLPLPLPSSSILSPPLPFLFCAICHQLGPKRKHVNMRSTKKIIAIEEI